MTLVSLCIVQFFLNFFFWFLFSGCFTTVFKSLIIITFAVFFTRIALLRGNEPEDVCFNHDIQANPMKTGPKIEKIGRKVGISTGKDRKTRLFTPASEIFFFSRRSPETKSLMDIYHVSNLESWRYSKCTYTPIIR